MMYDDVWWYMMNHDDVWQSVEDGYQYLMKVSNEMKKCVVKLIDEVDDDVDEI